MIDNTTELSGATSLKIAMNRLNLDYQSAAERWGISEWGLRKVLSGEMESPLGSLTIGDLGDAEVALALRLELGFSQAQVAAMMGVSRMTIWLVENGGSIDGWAPDPGEMILALTAYIDFEQSQV